MRSLWGPRHRQESLGRLAELSRDAARSWGTRTPHAKHFDHHLRQFGC